MPLFRVRFVAALGPIEQLYKESIFYIIYVKLT